MWFELAEREREGEERERETLGFSWKLMHARVERIYAHIHIRAYTLLPTPTRSLYQSLSVSEPSQSQSLRGLNGQPLLFGWEAVSNSNGCGSLTEKKGSFYSLQQLHAPSQILIYISLWQFIRLHTRYAAQVQACGSPHTAIPAR